MTVVQTFGSQNVTKIKCSKWVSKFLMYYRTYSHQKLLGPPFVMEPELMSEIECDDMYSCKAYIIDGKTMRIGLNQQIQFPEGYHGRIYSDKFNVYCEGSRIIINGEQHEWMFELRSVTITMSEIDVEISPDRIVEIPLQSPLHRLWLGRILDLKFKIFLCNRPELCCLIFNLNYSWSLNSRSFRYLSRQIDHNPLGASDKYLSSLTVCFSCLTSSLSDSTAKQVLQHLYLLQGVRLYSIYCIDFPVSLPVYFVSSW